ncbi:MAG TPA: MFS transporter, partial [Planctomycetota bacterium]|nr:MFS transporter [Planctomycetota bacterium]
LRLPDYRFYVLSTIIGVIGTQIQALAVAWEIYERTKDPLALAYIGLARALPFFLFGLIAGQMADWFNRKYLLILSQFTSMLCALGIAALSYYQAPVWCFYAVLFLRASAGTLGMPARQAMLPQIVPQNVFTNAITWNSGTFHLALVIGPAIGGVVLAAGPLYAYLIDAVGLSCAVFFMLFVKVRSVELKREPLTLSGFLAGASFVWNTKIMLATLSLDLFAVLLGGATALLPIYASEEMLNCGPEGLGWLRAAPAVGSCVMALLLVYLPPMKNAGRTLLLMVAGFGAATVLFGISTNFWLSVFMLFLTGVFDQVSVVVRHTLVQVLSPDQLRGRISAVNSIFIGASNQLGELESGLAAKFGAAMFSSIAAGAIFSAVTGGIGTMLVVLGIAIKFPQVAAIGRLEDVKPASADEPKAEKTATAA